MPEQTAIATLDAVVQAARLLPGKTLPAPRGGSGEGAILIN
jgi:hypothetical protein